MRIKDIVERLRLLKEAYKLATTMQEAEMIMSEINRLENKELLK